MTTKGVKIMMESLWIFTKVIWNFGPHSSPLPLILSVTRKYHLHSTLLLLHQGLKKTASKNHVVIDQSLSWVL